MGMADEDRDYSTAMRDRIEEWLQQEGWQVGHQTAEGARWVLTLRDNQGRPLVLAHLAQGRDRLLVQIGIRLADDLQRQLGNLEARNRRNLIYDIHESLIMIGIQWADIREPLREFRIEAMCYFEGLSKDALLQKLIRVRDGGILVMQKLSRALDQPPPVQPESRHIGFRTVE